MRETADSQMPTEPTRTKTKPAAPAARKGAAKSRTAEVAALERATAELAREREAVERAVAEMRALRTHAPRTALPSYRRPIPWSEAAIFAGGLAVLVLLMLLVVFS